MAIHKEVIGNELYVWCNGSLLYKRWIDRGYGKVMDRQPFTAKDTESFKNKGHVIQTSNGNTMCITSNTNIH